MKRGLLFLILPLIVAAQVGCQRPRTTTEVVVQRDTPLPETGGGMGGVDSGGGNTYKGRPLDFYRRDLFTAHDPQNPDHFDLQPELNAVLHTIHLVKKTNIPFAAAMLHILRERSWYFIGIELNRIPALSIGVQFQTDQAALQRMKEVWINSIIYKTMAPNERAGLMLHEVLMGVRLLAFTSDFDRCLANAAKHILFDDGVEDHYGEARKQCVKAERGRIQPGGYSELLGQIRLTESDYAHIRTLTDDLSKSTPKIPDADELDLWLVRAGLAPTAPAPAPPK